MGFSMSKDEKIMNLSKCLIAAGLLVATMVLVEQSVAGSGSDGEIRLEARLSRGGPEPSASGKARFEKRDDGVRLSIEVEDVIFADSVEFIVNGNSLGTLGIAGGGADLNLSGSSVPDISSGSSVTVRDETGAVILSGSF